MKINIRKFQEDDIDGFYEAVRESIDHLSSWLPWCTENYSPKDAEHWVLSAENAWLTGDDYRFIIEDLDTRKILGSVAINQVVQQHKTGNLGYWIRKSSINQGACRVAAQLAVDFAFNELGFHRIEIQVLPDNTPSIKVAENIGGVYEGLLRNKLYVGGKPCPAQSYSIIPEDRKSKN